MTKLTYDDLHNAFLAHRRAHGLAETRKILASFGAEFLEGVPEDRWADAIKALSVGASAEAKRESATTEAAELDPEAIYAKWNAAGNRGRS